MPPLTLNPRSATVGNNFCFWIWYDILLLLYLWSDKNWRIFISASKTEVLKDCTFCLVFPAIGAFTLFFEFHALGSLKSIMYNELLITSLWLMNRHDCSNFGQFVAIWWCEVPVLSCSWICYSMILVYFLCFLCMTIILSLWPYSVS